MKNNANILVVIPARGGSKGIPRKNLRNLAGFPLIYYSIKTALKLSYNCHVVVSTDDDEIATIAKKSGARIHKRNPVLATDATTLDPVIYDVFQNFSVANNIKYDLIITLQPTSPLLNTDTLNSAIKLMLENNAIETLISACDDTHLTWRKEGEQFVPNYEKRVNRQYLPKKFKETGSFLICRGDVIEENSRIGKNVQLYLLSGKEAIDIDTYEDWNICEYYLRRKRILFVVSGYNEIGLGHVYNVLSIANEILNHELIFLVDKKSELGKNKISDNNYTVYIQQSDKIVDDIDKIRPDIIVNDVLDTDEDYMHLLKSKGYGVINFEDLGSGAKHADIVINAMYPEKEKYPNHYFGHAYFCLKSEFYLTSKKVIRPEVKSVLLTFGGVDPNNFTFKVLNAIYAYCTEKGIELNIIAGFGYDKYSTLDQFEKIKIHRNIGNISDFMHEADLVFTSAGRTTFEVASLGIPAIVLCQNERETTHFFAKDEFGFVNLGLGTNVSDTELLNFFEELVTNFDERKRRGDRMLKQGITEGKARVVKLIQDFISSFKN